MAGTFNKANRPALAGSYFNWEAEGTDALPVSLGAIVAIPATADWGPLRQTVLLRSFGEFTAVYGGGDTPLRRAVYSAFKGEGRPGHGGAGAVIVFRQGTSSAAPATKALNNTAAAAALTLTALYYGTRGNDFRFTTQAGAVGGTTDLIILDGTLEVERYNFPSAYASGDATTLAATINAESNFFSAVAGASGVALAAVTNSAATGGNDGDTLTSAEWIAAQDALDAERWSIIPAYGLTDGTIRSAFVAWIQQRNLLGHRSMAVIGGLAAETAATANSRSQAINDWDIVNIGVGTLHLDDLGVDVSTAQMTARVAGAIANRGESRDLIYARFADVSVAAGSALATLTQQEAALKAGTTLFCQDTNVDAPLFIREGVTTYADDSASTVDEEGHKTHPVVMYKRIKNLRIQHGIELEVEDWATSGVALGELPVNERSRAIVLGFIKTVYQRREDAEIVQPGWTVLLDNDPPPDDDQDYVQYRHGFHPTRSMRQMFHTARIG